MPHITIQMYTGRDEKTKKEIAGKMAEALSSAMNMEKKNISVSIQEIEKEKWKAEVYDKVVDENNEEVLIKPGYQM